MTQPTGGTAMDADPTIVVPALLTAAGIRPSATEVAIMIAGYAALAASLDDLYAVPGVRYEEAALFFRAVP